MAIKATKQKLLSALFAKAAKVGIDADTLRDQIALEVIGRRLSDARPIHIVQLLDHITGLYNGAGLKQNKSSWQGLVDELRDIARARWGEDYEQSLRAFINSHGFKGTLTAPKFMDIAKLKAFKERLKKLNEQDGIKQHG